MNEMTILELNKITAKMVKDGHGNGLVRAKTAKGLGPAKSEMFALDTSGITNVKPLLVVNTDRG